MATPLRKASSCFGHSSSVLSFPAAVRSPSRRRKASFMASFLPASAARRRKQRAHATGKCRARSKDVGLGGVDRLLEGRRDGLVIQSVDFTHQPRSALHPGSAATFSVDAFEQFMHRGFVLGARCHPEPVAITGLIKHRHGSVVQPVLYAALAAPRRVAGNREEPGREFAVGLEARQCDADTREELLRQLFGNSVVVLTAVSMSQQAAGSSAARTPSTQNKSGNNVQLCRLPAREAGRCPHKTSKTISDTATASARCQWNEPHGCTALSAHRDGLSMSSCFCQSQLSRAMQPPWVC